MLVRDEDVAMLQSQSKIGGRARETASIRPVERAAEVSAEPKHVGGGWYELPNGERVQGKAAAQEAMRR